VVRRTCLDMYVVYPTRASLSIHTCKFENWVGIRENIRSYEQIKLEVSFYGTPHTYIGFSVWVK
jgi:hypothetical protein